LTYALGMTMAPWERDLLLWLCSALDCFLVKLWWGA
jgi:hypothetical protein